MSNGKKPVVLCILDGWGIGDQGDYDGIAKANTPNWDSILGDYPNSTLITHGEGVGLPAGQMGNSEVGHTNIGAGRVVMQFLPRIEKALKDNSVKDLDAMKGLISALKKSGGVCHLMGLVSDGGVHAHIDHIIALAKVVSAEGVTVKIHAFTDGRDTAPQSGKGYIQRLEVAIESIKAEIATVSGRYYAMDRDNRWERVEKAYQAIVNANGEKAASAKDAVQNSYDSDITDEFIAPTVVGDYGGVEKGDAVLFANFRSDRAREILQAFLVNDFEGFHRGKKPEFFDALGMVQYSDELNEYMDALFPPETHKNILGEVLANEGLKQLRIAETEKYPHVTFFFNNGREDPYEGEERILVPSPKVATYDLQPEMSAPEVTKKVKEAIESDKFDVIIINYANPDMVGHTGDIEAVKKAVETVDDGIGIIKEAILEKGGALILCADHGNAEKMWDVGSNGPHTAHTTNVVPYAIVSNDRGIKLQEGRLADLAPTVLFLADLAVPEDMTGQVLIK